MRITAKSTAVLLLLLLVEPALAQTRSGGGGGASSGGFGSSGGSGGGSSGGFGGSGTGGFGSGSGSGSSGSGSFTGSGSSGSSFAGGSGGNFTGGTTSGSSFLRGGSRTTQSTDPTYKYNGNPLAIGLASPTSNSAGSQYLRQFPVQLSFGNPLYSGLGTTTGLTGGTATLGLGGTGSAGIGSPFAGANSMGIRRAPGYTVSMAFDPPPPRARAEIRTDLQQVISQSSRLSSRDNIRVTMDGDTVVLQGRVTNDRERRLAEALVRLTPGVREVRNDITVGSKGGG